MESDILTIIGQFGFPIAVTVYLLVTRDKTIDKNTQAINDLRTAIEIMCEKK